MVENAAKMGKIFGGEIAQLKSKLIKEVRGRGLFHAIEIVSDARVNGNDLSYCLKDVGLLTKATHNYNLRLAPALIITEDQI